MVYVCVCVKTVERFSVKVVYRKPFMKLLLHGLQIVHANLTAINGIGLLHLNCLP